MDLDKLLTKAQTTAAKKRFRIELDSALSDSIREEALKIARQFIKENKQEIQAQAVKAYKKELDKNLTKIARDALHRTCLYIDS